MAFKKIAEWDVNIDYYSKYKTLAALKKCAELFDNLPPGKRDEAFEELWQVIKPPASEEKAVD